MDRLFVKKPVVVKAHQLGEPIPEGSFVSKAVQEGHIVISNNDVGAIVAQIQNNPTGIINVAEKDWIVEGNAGEMYAIKEEIFPTIYDAHEGSEAAETPNEAEADQQDAEEQDTPQAA